FDVAPRVRPHGTSTWHHFRLLNKSPSFVIVKMDLSGVSSHHLDGEVKGDSDAKDFLETRRGDTDVPPGDGGIIRYSTVISFLGQCPADSNTNCGTLGH